MAIWWSDWLRAGQFPCPRLLKQLTGAGQFADLGRVGGIVFNEETLEVRDQYRRLGLQAPKLNREPDDHIGLELDFLAQCCVSALTAVEQGAHLAAERYVHIAADFTRDHLLVWAPEMLARAEEEARTEWMRGLELLSRGALNVWRQAVEEIA